MKNPVYLSVLGAAILALSLIVHPFTISFADFESYETTLSLCESGVGASGELLSEEFSFECSQIGKMGTIVLGARAGWIAGAGLFALGLFLNSRKKSPKKKK